MFKLCTTLLWLLVPVCIWSQASYALHFQSGTLESSALSEPEHISLAQLNAVQYGAHYYLLLQFNDIPDAAQRDALQKAGITLFTYIPNYAYVARVAQDTDLKEIPVRGIFLLQAEHKLSPALAAGDYPIYALTGNAIEVNVTLFPALDQQPVLTRLTDRGYTVSLIRDVLRITLPLEDLAWLTEQPYVQYVEAVSPDPKLEPDGLTGRALQRLNQVSKGPGDGLDGAGVQMALGDDGSINHPDLNDRLIDLTTTDFGTHAEMTAGILAGSGSLDPKAMGMAPAATLRLFDIDGYTHLFSAPQLYQQHRVVVTSTSFGEGCGGTYTVNARHLDQQVYDHPQVLHVFSAGNHAAKACSNNYGKINSPDGLHFGNISGGMKAGKNVLAIGNVEAYDYLQIRSSRGPAADGRIKPDLCAMGQGQYTLGQNGTYQYGSGTSAAAPAAAGSAALIYQAFRQKNNNQDPSSALVKALLLNTADDLGRPGPDYAYGWGRINIARAVESLNNRQYQQGTLRHGQASTHSIQVPSGTSQLRAMVYWHDPAGSPLSGRALINDLDLRITTPGGQDLRPWRLSTVAHRDSLLRPAWRGIDRFNNVEQVTITNPAAGRHTLHLQGHRIPEGPQDYVIVYYFEKQDLNITYPARGESLTPGEDAIIRWDATGEQGGYTLEFSANNGQSWSTVRNGIPANAHHATWTVPDQPTGQGRLRLRRGSQSTISEPFAILSIPEFTLQYHDDQHARMEWQQVAGADTYDIFQLQDGQMKKIGSTTQNSYLLPQEDAWQSSWYSIRAKSSGNGAAGQRARAQNYVHRFCDRQITLRLRFDFYPAETSWEITSDDGAVLASGSGYDGDFANQEIEITECLPVGCFTFTMYDAFGDGICCANGEGYYQLLNEDGTLIASGGKFAAKASRSFCLSPQSDLSVQIQQLQQISCPGGHNGTLSAIVTGNTGDVSYQWNTGATTPVITNLPSGNYEVTVTEGNSRQSAAYELTDPAHLELLFIRQHNDCEGDNQGKINVLAQGGTPPYSYLWNTGQSSAQLQNLPAGQYTLTLTDSRNCTVSATTEIEGASSLLVTERQTDPTCWNEENGTIRLNISGGMPPYAVKWNDGTQRKERSNLPEGTYAYTITDSKGCAQQDTIRLKAPAPLSVKLTQEEASCNKTTPTVFSQVSGGRPPYEYLWSDGSTQANRTDLSGGTYTLTVTDNSGCSDTQSITVADSAPALSVLINQTHVSCYNGQDGQVQAIARGGEPPYAYTWQNSKYGNSAVLSGVAAGTYRLTVTDARGCTSSSSVTIKEPDSMDLRLAISPADCGESTGSARVMVRGGQLPYSFNWSNGSALPQSGDLPSGLHHVTVTDKNGCTAARAVTISAVEGPKVAIEKKRPSCGDQPDGRLQAVATGGKAPYSYSWSAGGSLPVRSQLRPGVYTVTVTDASGCQTVVETELTAPPAISLQVEATDVSCAGNSDGHINVIANGGTAPFAYTWSNGLTTAKASDLPPGTYAVTVTDAAGCSQKETITIQQPDPLSITGIVSDQPCQQDASGSISLTASGGRAPYTYLWNTGQTANQLSGLSPGRYTVQLTDAAGCTLEDSFAVQEKTEATIDFEIVPPTCAAEDDGMIHPTITGATAPYTYQWSNGSQASALIDVPAGTFSLTVSDANQCQTIDTVSLPEPPPLQVSIQTYPSTGLQGGQIDLTVSGGTPPYTYQWSNGAGTQDVHNVPDGLYTVTLTDAYGCSQVHQATVREIQADFCEHEARNASYEWIESIAIGKFINVSGPNSGFGDFTQNVIGLKAGNHYRLLLEPGYSRRAYYENWYIWIDLNGDRDFDDAGELLFQGKEKGLLQNTLSIPSLTHSQTTRMRIAMRFLEDASPCGTFSYGEVEDYTVHINAGAPQYCAARGTVSNRDWIEKVRINDEERNSGPNEGYGDFTDEPIYADLKENAQLSLTLNHRRPHIDQHWRVWIDYNQNGEFSDDEIVIAKQAASLLTRTDILWPEGLPNGQYRMRVLLKWGTPPLQSCGSFYWGEVEDYTLNLQRDAESWTPAVFRPRPSQVSPFVKVFPNPTHDLVNLTWHQEAAWQGRLFVVNILGKIVDSRPLDVRPGRQTLQINLSHLPAGRYELRIGKQSFPVVVMH